MSHAFQRTAADVGPELLFTGHVVRVPAFEGPLDLLLHLIKRSQLDIWQIPVASITAQYVEYLALAQALDIELAADFCRMAAALVELKSRLLLPPEPEADGGGPDGSDYDDDSFSSRAALAARLAEYERYKQAAAQLRERAALWEWVFPRPTSDDGNGHVEGNDGYVLVNEVSAFDLWAAFQEVLARAREPEVGEIRRPQITVAGQVAALVRALRAHHGEMAFGGLFERVITRLEIIVTFLALLELIRRGRVRVRQEGAFGDIWVEYVSA